jgi:hypothetical protein
MTSKHEQLHEKWINLISSKLKVWASAPVSHFCNPSYSGDRDKEDFVSKPDQANSS